MHDELKPCPFCGSESELRNDDGFYCIVCSSHQCYCAVGEGYDNDGGPDHIFDTEEEAITAWNRRPI